jgi:hypothetical protein
MLLVDSGRFAYSGTDRSATLHVEYARNASAHNTLTFDGCDQLPAPAVADAPLPNASVSLSTARDSAFGSMSAYDPACLAGAATHTRGVVYTRGAAGGDADGDFFVVVDGVASDRARDVQAFWHAHPNATGGIAIDAATLAATVGGADIAGRPAAAQACVVPARAAAGVAGAAAWARAAVVAGVVRDDATGARWQGWYSASYDDSAPAPTAIYSARVAGGAAPTAFGWLIVPTAGRAPCAAHDAVIVAVAPGAVVVSVSVAGAAHENVTVPR